MVMLEVKNLTKKFGSRTPVNGISFQLEAGSCTALLGPNGAGKTTTLRMLAGLINPTSGSIVFNGTSNKNKNANEQGLIGYLPQHPAFYGWMTGKEFVVYVAGLSGMNGRKAASEADIALERVGLKDAARRRISGYSGGMKQRLGLAQAIVHRPQLLLLDEPVSALDPLGRREVMDLLSQLRQQTTVLFSTHVLHDAEEVCDRMMLLKDGDIVENGRLGELAEKYRQPLLTLEVEAGAEEKCKLWLRSFQDRKFVLESTVRRNTAVLTVSDVKLARYTILQEAASQDIPLLRFEAGTTSLEDMFMKVVKS
jgi:ABC-2 type transport system ATP-binding protein